MDRILLLLWAVGFLFSSFFTIGSLIITLCLKGRARSIAVNFLLVIATLNLVHIVAVPYLSVPTAPEKDKSTRLAAALKKWSGSLDEASKIEYAQKRWPILKCGTVFDFPFRDPATTFREEIEFDADDATQAEVMETVVGLRMEHALKERVLKVDIIDQPVIEQLPQGWIKDEALRFNAVHSKTNPRYLVELERKRQAEGERFAVVMALYCLYHVVLVVSGLVVVSNSILWLRSVNGGPDRSIRLAATGRTIYSVFVIGIYSSMLATIPSEILIAVFRESIPKLSSTALSSISGTLGIMIGGLLAAKKFVLDKSGLTMKEAFPLQVAAGEWPLRIKQGFLTFLASATLSSIIWVTQWNLFGPIGTKNAFNISIPQLASDFHLDAVVLNAVAIILVAPISEEILFRGLLFGWLRRGHSLMIATAVSALCFALCHFDVQLIPNLFFVGIVFAISYERTRCLVPNMIGHALHNLAMVLAVFLVR